MTTKARFLFGASLAIGLVAAVAPGAAHAEPMPTTDPAGYHLVFSDDFTTAIPLGQFPAASGGKWLSYPDGWKDTSKHGTYSATKTVSVADGILDEFIHTENGVHYVTNIRPNIPWGMTYGKYSIRMRADANPGSEDYKIVPLLWPDSGNQPVDGEIDWPEATFKSTINAVLHRRGGGQTQFHTGAHFSAWHTYSMAWTPTMLRFSLDGEVVGTITDTAIIPNKAMHWLLQTEGALDGSTPRDWVSTHVQIDWVAVYALN